MLFGDYSQGILRKNNRDSTHNVFFWITLAKDAECTCLFSFRLKNHVCVWLCSQHRNHHCTWLKVPDMLLRSVCCKHFHTRACEFLVLRQFWLAWPILEIYWAIGIYPILSFSTTSTVQTVRRSCPYGDNVQLTHILSH